MESSDGIGGSKSSLGWRGRGWDSSSLAQPYTEMVWEINSQGKVVERFGGLKWRKNGLSRYAVLLG